MTDAVNAWHVSAHVGLYAALTFIMWIFFEYSSSSGRFKLDLRLRVMGKATIIAWCAHYLLPWLTGVPAIGILLVANYVGILLGVAFIEAYRLMRRFPGRPGPVPISGALPLPLEQQGRQAKTPLMLLDDEQHRDKKVWAAVEKTESEFRQAA